MGFPAALIELSPLLAKAGVHLGQAIGPTEAEGLPFGIEELDRVLPDHGLLRGGVVELAVQGASGLGTSLALAAVRAVQKEAQRGSFIERAVPWCAFVDPSATLYGPGVTAAGVDAERLLVVRPPLEAVGRTALKLAESEVFSLIVVDAFGTLGQSLDVSLASFGRVIRRLSMAVDGTRSSVLLLTDASQPRSLPLPVAQRLVVSRPGIEQLAVQVAKDRRGRVSPLRSLRWTRGKPAEKAVIDGRKRA